MEDETVLCGASYYNKKFYLNEAFDKLPTQVKDELKIMCVLYTEEVGGVFTLFFDDEGNLELRTTCEEGDLLYDEIGAALKIGKMRAEKAELFESLELFYRVFILGIKE
ncbi:MAG: hypothetical protein IKQ56_07360 [Lachnospiraceae bacterium]|nr:hypothetical protein [Lachnospiraceae bacterium]